MARIKIIHLEGTTLEGGGQLLRISAGISALTAIPIRITNIRGNRSGGGGLKSQHLAAVNWLAKACQAEVDGAQVKSRTLKFEPSHRHECPDFAPWCKKRILLDGTRALETEINVGSPGSVNLVFQAILPFILFSAPYPNPSSDEDDSSVSTTPPAIRLTIVGGTNVSLSPSFEYISHVLLPTLARIGLHVSATLNSRGWSTGRSDLGSVTFAITPLPRGSFLPSFSLTSRGRITSVSAYVLAPGQCTERAVREALTGALGDHVAFASDESDGSGVPQLDVALQDSRHQSRLYLLLVATSENGHKLGRDWLYNRKVGNLPDALSKLVRRVVTELAAEIAHGGCVDEHMRDQLAVFQALAKGKSVVDAGRGELSEATEASLHTRTAEWVASELLPGVEFDGEGSCEGVGFVAGETFAARKKTRGVETVVPELEELQL